MTSCINRINKVVSLCEGVWLCIPSTGLLSFLEMFCLQTVPAVLASSTCFCMFLWALIGPCSIYSVWFPDHWHIPSHGNPIFFKHLTQVSTSTCHRILSFLGTKLDNCIQLSSKNQVGIEFGFQRLESPAFQFFSGWIPWYLTTAPIEVSSESITSAMAACAKCTFWVQARRDTCRRSYLKIFWRYKPLNIGPGWLQDTNYITIYNNNMQSTACKMKHTSTKWESTWWQGIHTAVLMLIMQIHLNCNLKPGVIVVGFILCSFVSDCALEQLMSVIKVKWWQVGSNRRALALEMLLANSCKPITRELSVLPFVLIGFSLFCFSHVCWCCPFSAFPAFFVLFSMKTGSS